MEAHELAKAFPPMTNAEYTVFKMDIEKHGQREPITLYEGKILDGVHRHKACKELKKRPYTRDYSEINNGNSPLDYVTSMNLARRHLTTSQRAMVSARLANVTIGNNQHSKGGSNEPPRKVTRREASQKMKVAVSSTRRARVVLTKGSPELIKAVEEGNISVATAAQAAKDGLVPEVVFHGGGPQVSDEEKIARCCRDLLITTSYLVEFNRPKLAPESVKELIVSRRNISRLLKANKGGPNVN